MQDDGGDRRAHAERGGRNPRPPRKPGDGPQAPVLRQDGRLVEMQGDAVDAGPVADEDRRLADLGVRASDVPGGRGMGLSVMT